jgi:outer membrane protein assembly factor BamD (BamD/ComL family)
MRAIAGVSLACVLIHAGCGSHAEAPQPTAAATINPNVEAARLYAVAEKLAQEGKTKDALSTYRHIQRDFPKSAQSKKARERIKRLPAAR